MNKLILLLLLVIANIAYADPSDSDDYVANLEQRVNELTDKLEQLVHQNDILQKKFDSLAKDVDFRVSELESKKRPAAPVAVENDQESAKEEEKIAPKEEPVKPGDPKLAKEQFEHAYTLLKEQRYEEAEVALNEFLKAYPKSEYSGNAYYWLGESFMLRKRYDKAAVNYLSSVSKFPKSSKADLSMLKLSMALNKLGKAKEACTILAKLKLKKDKLNPAATKLLEKELAKSSCK